MTRLCAICGTELRDDNHANCCLECRLLAQAEFFEDEVWLPIVGHQGWEISDRGRIRGANSHRIVVPDDDRYPRVWLNGRRRRVHVLMAETWLGPRPFGMQILHADDRPANAHIANIRYGTAAANAADRTRDRAAGDGQAGPRGA
jgi:hypothetical protein